MNCSKEELIKDMKYLGWKKVNKNMFPRFDDDDIDVFILNGFIAYKRNYYIVLNGQMPIDFAQKLFDNYDNMKYKIRINGGYEGTSPKESNKEHSELEKFIHEECNIKIDGFKLWCKKIEQKEKELLKNDYKSFYIKTYHIDTFEGVRIITELIKENNIQSKWFE